MNNRERLIEAIAKAVQEDSSGPSTAEETALDAALALTDENGVPLLVNILMEQVGRMPVFVLRRSEPEKTP